MTLPHSTANVERIFSSVNLTKNNVRNRLHIENVEAYIYV